ncbi:hypothetical protein [Costertonia aggregata]|uniref:Uncharacterized protein n=1 Tax=Costertonia aggregata TaxID=343403 RepID=A0A7H9ASY4_9FLAO|nr:hypothetical protein [Costertonia aggregata]QLG46588.1 hypothetical protein HYG79_14935 [Costertonia aggregata]
MGKKLNVKDLLESAILDNMDTQKEVKGLRDERDPDITENKLKDNDLENIASQRPTVERFPTANLNESERKKVADFELFLEENRYSDKKEQFIFRLSKTCFEDYEKLASAYNYKLNKKVSRNDIMRKALELYHDKSVMRLKDIIDRI